MVSSYTSSRSDDRSGLGPSGSKAVRSGMEENISLHTAVASADGAAVEVHGRLKAGNNARRDNLIVGRRLDTQ